MLTIDFETRSKVDIRKSGAWRYAEDPSTSVLCLAYALGDGLVGLWTPEAAGVCKDSNPDHHYLSIPKTVIGAIITGKLIEAHNSFFERAIWRNIMVKRYGWPDIPDKQWRCSAARASAHCLPRSLDGVSEALDLPIKKNLDGKRIMLKLARPRKPSKNNPKEWFDDPKDFEKLYDYCKNDVATERCVSETLRPLSSSELAIWQLDQKINERGIRVDVPASRGAIHISEQHKNKLDEQITDLTSGQVTATSQVGKIKQWITSNYHIEVGSLDKNNIVELIRKFGPNSKGREVLSLRMEAAKTSTAKYQAIINSVCADGRLRDLFMYHGASTGRWSGKLVQPQNFPRNDFKGDLEKLFAVLRTGSYELFEMCYDDVMGTLSKCSRGVFIPSEGMDFYGGDYSGVELRMAFWLAGDEDALKAVREGRDPYVEFARGLFNTKLVSEQQRHLGKTCMLAGIYGIGKEHLRNRLAQGGVDISENDSHEMIHYFREKYYLVTKFWYEQNQVALEAVRTGQAIRTKMTTWAMHRGFLYCKLPSGRNLAYYRPQINEVIPPWEAVKVAEDPKYIPATVPALTYLSVNSITRKFERTHTYGGKITENIDSGSCRDILAPALLRCEEVGYRVVMHTHDEILTEKEVGSVDEIQSLMTVQPQWCRDLPLDASCWTGKRYLK